MRPFIAVIAIIVAVAVVTSYAEGHRNRCAAGTALGFATIQPDPAFLVGTIPSKFTSDARYFARRFSCLARPAEVRRVDLGTYDVRFPGLNPVTIAATVVSDEGIYISAIGLGDGIVRVAMRGPVIDGDVASRRDVAFTVVIY